MSQRRNRQLRANNRHHADDKTVSFGIAAGVQRERPGGEAPAKGPNFFCFAD
jgi:hypothetical protein